MKTSTKLGLWALALYLLVGLVGPSFIELERTPDYDARFSPMGWAHPLGTDYAGRDVLAQLVHGAGDIFLIAFSAGAFAVLFAFLIGVGGALAKGVTDTLLLGMTDIFLTVPSFPLMAILSALFQVGDPITFGLLLALWSWPGLARSLRSQVLSLQHREFIEVCRLMCMGPWHILWREIFPNLIPYITLNFILISRNAITASVGIMMLGLVPLKVETWGMMLNLAAFQSGAIFLPQGMTYLMAPLLAIVLFQYSLILVASGVEELFDPRLRRG